MSPRTKPHSLLLCVEQTTKCVQGQNRIVYLYVLSRRQNVSNDIYRIIYLYVLSRRQNVSKDIYRIVYLYVLSRRQNVSKNIYRIVYLYVLSRRQTVSTESRWDLWKLIRVFSGKLDFR